MRASFLFILLTLWRTGGAQTPLPAEGFAFRQIVNNWFAGASSRATVEAEYGLMQDWDTSGVTDMREAFRSRFSFNEDISRWDTSSVTDMGLMFLDAWAFNQSIGDWDTSSVTDMRSMFAGTAVFNQDISRWNTSGVTDMRSMFASADAFNQDISGWDVRKVEGFGDMFFLADSFNQTLCPWGVNPEAIKSLRAFFDLPCNLPLPSNGFDFKRAITQWFTDPADSNSTYGPIERWNTSQVTDMSQSFRFSNMDNDLGSWDTSSVVNMSRMFQFANTFPQNIGGWDVQNVRDMSGMFSDTFGFNQEIGSWDVGSVTNMSAMFFDAEVFNQDIGGWDTSSVVDTSGMFSNAQAFNQDIGNWDVSSVVNMSELFLFAEAFNQDIGGWDTSSVVDMSGTFSNAPAFNQDIADWNVEKVETFDMMFSFALAFDQSLCNWLKNPNAAEDISGRFFKRCTPIISEELSLVLSFALPTALVLISFLCFASKRTRALVFVCGFAIIDVGSDILYVTTQSFANDGLFAAALVILSLPMVVFALASRKLWIKAFTSKIKNLKSSLRTLTYYERHSSKLRNLLAILIIFVLICAGIFIAIGIVITAVFMLSLKLMSVPELSRRVFGEISENDALFLLNGALLFEVVLESVPQLVIVGVNTALNSANTDENQLNAIFWITVVGSSASIINTSYPFFYYMARERSVRKALEHDIFTPKRFFVVEEEESSKQLALNS